jgi:selenocysteine lyase/cysteine desulfurase
MMAGESDFAALRALYPALRKWTWLDAAATSPLATPVAEAGRRLIAELEQDGDRGFLAWIAEEAEARRKVAALLGARPEEIAFVPSSSHAMSYAAHFLRAEGARRVVTLRDEFPSSTVPFLALGYQLVFVAPRGRAEYALEDIAGALGGGDVLVASHVQYATGFRLDLGALGKLAAERGASLVVNATQSLGALPVSVSCGARFLCASGHKWLQAGHGASLMYLRDPEALRGWPVSGWLANHDPMSMRNDAFDPTTAASRLEGGVKSYLPIYLLSAALDLLAQARGPAATEPRILALVRRLRARMRARGFLPVCEGESGITVYPVADPAGMVRVLRERKVAVSARGAGVRASVHWFNSEADVDTFAETFASLAATTR